MIQARKVWKSFDLGSSHLEILCGVDFAIQKGEFVSIVGASGTGKSTLLHILGGLDQPDAGEIELNEVSLVGLNEPETARFRNRTIGFVFQFHHLLPEFTALENVAIPQIISGRERAQAYVNARQRLAEVGLEDREDHLPSQLSGGERQRVAIARALVNNPLLLLMDEPTGNLDPRTGEKLFALITQLQRDQNLTTVMVTHNHDLAAQSDRRLVLDEGVLKEIH